MPFTKTPELTERIAREIGQRNWPKEGKLPSVRGLAAEYRVSSKTAHGVLQVLHQRGLLVQDPRTGR